MTERTCPECHAAIVGRDDKVYCSEPCQGRGKYRRRNPTAYQPRATRFCELASCERKHFALGSCRQHYYQQRAADGKDGCRPAPARVQVGALATAKGGASSRPCLVMCDLLDNGGMFVYCPDCSGWACVRGNDPMVRVCDRCETTIRVNTEEASWVLYETLSMAS